jgi:hypothetical protein
MAKKGTFEAGKTQENRVMKKLFLAGLLALGLTGPGLAQRGQVSIDQDPGIGKLLEIYKEANASAGFYTIQIGFGTYTYAEELKEEVSLEFPEYQPRIVFDSPTYRVQVGQFRNRLEAEKKYLEIRRKFPGALLLKPEER